MKITLHGFQKETENCPKSILRIDTAKHQLVYGKHEALQSIERAVYIASRKNKVDLICSTEDSVNQGWKKYCYYNLTTTHKSHLFTEQLLDDIHMGAAQELIKTQFPHINGL